MAVDDFERIDIVSSDDEGSVVLIVSDHLDWSDSISHQRTLQRKLNVYLVFVKSGELLEKFPDAVGKPVVLRVVALHAPDPDGAEFLRRVRVAIEHAGLGFQHSLREAPSRSETHSG